MKNLRTKEFWAVGGLFTAAAGLAGYGAYLDSKTTREYWNEVEVVNNLEADRDEIERKIVTLVDAYSKMDNGEDVINTCKDVYSKCDEKMDILESCQQFEELNACIDFEDTAELKHDVRMHVIACCESINRQTNECLTEMLDCYIVGK